MRTAVPNGYISIFNWLNSTNPSTLGAYDPSRCSHQGFNQYDKHDNTTLSNLLGSGYTQRYLIGKISKTWDSEGHTTWYNYDDMGRTVWMVQDLPGLGIKIIHYTYDFQGNILEVAFQKAQVDAFYHKYDYDKDNRLVRSYISNDGKSWQEQSEYKYYKHGPTKRIEIDKDLQGIDYVYTVDGKLKQLNHPGVEPNSCTVPSIDPGNDGGTGSVFPTDVFGFSLDYHVNDYKRINSITTLSSSFTDRFDGQIKKIQWGTQSNTHTYGGQLMYSYEYDQFGQLELAQFGGLCGGGGSAVDDYKVSGLSYDRNGNIQTLDRNAHVVGNSNPKEMDRFTYEYKEDIDGNKTNMLDHVVDSGAGDGLYDDLTSQNPVNYTYDALGQLLSDQAGDTEMSYYPSGLVKEVKQLSTGHIRVQFAYNDRGHRIAKKTYNQNGVYSYTTWYVRDASGLLLSIYHSEPGSSATMARGSIGFNGFGSINQTELPIYGTGQLGIYYRGQNGNPDEKYYQLTDHLGNVRAVIVRDGSGNILVSTFKNYYPFGSPMTGPMNSNGPENYRYTYQGQEKDGETGWEAFELRMWDGRLGRWMSIDPMGQYASPYVGMGNNPGNRVDPDGGWDRKDEWITFTSEDGNTYYRRISNLGGDKYHYIYEAQDWDTFFDCDNVCSLPSTEFTSQEMFSGNYRPFLSGWQAHIPIELGPDLFYMSYQSQGIDNVDYMFAIPLPPLHRFAKYIPIPKWLSSPITKTAEQIVEKTTKVLLPGLKLVDRKLVQHASQWGIAGKGVALTSEQLGLMKKLAGHIHKHAREVRQGVWGNPAAGGFNNALFYSNGKHLVITQADGTLITILRNSMGNKHFNNAMTLWAK